MSSFTVIGLPGNCETNSRGTADYNYAFVLQTIYALHLNSPFRAVCSVTLTKMIGHIHANHA